MKIEIFGNAAGRQPYLKWYNDLDKTQRSAIDAQMERLQALDFKSDNGLPPTIQHLRNESATPEDERTDHLYTLVVRQKHLLVYFAVLNNKIILLHGCALDKMKDNLPAVRERYLEAQEQQDPVRTRAG